MSAKVGSIGDNRLGGWHSLAAYGADASMLSLRGQLEQVERQDAPVAVARQARRFHPAGVAPHIGLGSRDADVKREIDDRGGDDDVGHGVAERMNKIIDPDVRVLSFEEADPGFHARFSALSRRYRYSIADRSVAPNPMTSRYLLEVLWHIEVEPMVEAAKEFMGLKDFRAFCKERDGTTTIRELKEISVKRRSNGVIEIEVEADAFCHNMVRSVVGALMSAGSGRTTNAEIRKALKGKRNEHAYKVQAPQGLTLIKIAYPPKTKLAAQAELTQRMRTLEDN